MNREEQVFVAVGKFIIDAVFLVVGGPILGFIWIYVKVRNFLLRAIVRSNNAFQTLR